jgi:hypothetical protein
VNIDAWQELAHHPTGLDDNWLSNMTRVFGKWARDELVLYIDISQINVTALTVLAHKRDHVREPLLI